MEHYLEGEEISHEEIVTALKAGVTDGPLFPVTCGVATKNLATNRLLDAIVEDLPSPAKVGAVDARRRRRSSPTRDDATWWRSCSRRWPTPTPGRINLFRVYQGTLTHDSQRATTAARTRRSGSASCSCRRARRWATPTSSGPATSARVAKLKETHAGDVLSPKDRPSEAVACRRCPRR